ncbi:MAG: zinc-dependent metalloprotease, partial [Saprospiraceae bacterium]
GLGSNDIGMDRGKLIDTRVVKFEKHGDKLLLIQPNQKYRAISNNPLEIRAVEEAFAQSVIFWFKIEKKDSGRYIIDLMPMLMEDLNLVATQLKDGKQGTFKLDKGKSALYFTNTHAFPQNCEFETILTFVGEPSGRFIKSVTPSPESVTYRQHVSFIQLPDDKYKPRAFHPESGYFYSSYYDYATPIHSPIEKRFIHRHRLEKKYPNQTVSVPIKPIIYYIDSGCPEPVKSALIAGGKWWAQAYEAAGFKDAFDVRELPVGAHPLDVRYNMIQWVHRSTRGWSYGSAITDPRTGEIMKGHVSLGSLRVRQDFMLAQGLLSPYEDNDDNHGVMTKMALDRLHQLSAHEIGHTIGLAHNYAASTDGRSSVMDYPHPVITENPDGMLNFTNAYDDKIGAWDKRVIMYGYMPFANEEDEKMGLKKIIDENHALGLKYLTDQDARSLGSASPITHLWDNGKEPISELKRLLQLRSNALKNFGPNTIPNGTPLSELEKIFVPVYYMHRYQAEAVGKLIGGLEYHYAVKGFGKIHPLVPVAKEKQDEALSALLELMTDKNLSISAQISQWMYPPAFGYGRTSESFPTSSDPGFDKIDIQESAVGQIIDLLMQTDRLSRLANENMLSPYLKKINQWYQKVENDQVKKMSEMQYISRLLALKVADKSGHTLKSHIMAALADYTKNNVNPSDEDATSLYIQKMLSMTDQELKEIKLPTPSSMPPGAPIGSCSEGY